MKPADKKNDVLENGTLSNEEIDNTYKDAGEDGTPELISLEELAAIINSVQKALKTQPTNENRKYANLYVNENTFEEWKTLCDENGINYGPRVSMLMKDDIELLKILKILKAALQNKKLKNLDLI